MAVEHTLKAPPKAIGSRIRRPKLDRKIDLTMDGGRVVDMPPGWAFTITCPNHGERNFDFNPFRANGREELAGHLRDAIWNLRNEVEGNSLSNYLTGLRYFWSFLEDSEPSGLAVTRLDQIDAVVLHRYLAWLGMQIATNGPNNGQALSVGSQRVIYMWLKTLLKNRHKRHPEAVHPNLSFPRNAHPHANSKATHRPPYSINEQDRITAALNADLKRIHEGGETLDANQVLAVHQIIIGLAMGTNKQSLIELRRDSLMDHPLKDRRFIQTFKRRGHSTHATSIREAEPELEVDELSTIPQNIAEHFEFLCAYTAPLVEEAAKEDRGLAFLVRIKAHGRKGQVVRLNAWNARHCVAAFSKRHDLKDDRGRPLQLNIARLRPTMGTNLYRITKDIRKVQQVLGHANVETTEIYVERRLESERDHQLVLENMEQHFTPKVIEGKIMIAADGQFPVNIANLLDGGYNTGIARCKNPMRGKNPMRADATVVEEIESVCKKFLACFRCPNMMVFEDDLWRLFSFYYRLLSERGKIHPDHWMKTYAPIIRRVDRHIAPLFPADKVAEARAKAQKTPHPAWRGPVL
jgi:hypothetical protein